jgi:hypothetical protein
VEFLLATLAYPLLLAALAVGAGLLVDRVVGPLPGALLPALGLALLIATVSIVTYWGAIAPFAPIAALLVAAAGVALGWGRLRSVRPDWWVVAASVAVYLIVCAPILLSGRLTEAGYLLDTTAAFQVLGGDFIIDHGRDFSSLLADSTLRQTMERYFGTQYPAGGQLLLASGGRLVGVESLWLYQAFMALMVAFCVAPLALLARAASLPRAGAAVAGGLAAMPALVYAYVQTGSIKEITALPFVFTLGALLTLSPSLARRGWRGAATVGLIGAAGVAAIGIAFGAWLLVLLAAGLALLLVGSPRPRFDARAVAIWGGAFVVALLLLALPTFGPLSESLGLAKSLSTSNAAAVADPGNLARPLLLSQLAGVWLGGSYRVDPEYIGPTYFLIGLIAVAALFGLAFLIRRRIWTVLAFVAALAVVWLALTQRGTTWTDAKLLMMTSPIVVLVAAIGVESLRRGGRRIEALLVGGAIACGVLGSAALLYHDTNLMPTDRYEELLSIGDRFAGDGPALVPEFDEFTLYGLDELNPSGPGFSAKPAELMALADGSGTAYGASYDVDQLDRAVVAGYPLVVARRRPDTSRPPSGYRLAHRGTYYDVWKRDADAPEVLGFEPGGSGYLAAGVVPCARIGELAEQARESDGTLRYAERSEVVVVDPAFARKLPAGWGRLEGGGVGLGSPGRVDQRFEVPRAGRYRVWLRGDFGRRVTISVDGREVGSAAAQSGNAGNYARPFDVTLDAGRHVLTIDRPGGGLAPGDGSPSRLLAVVFEPLPSGPPAARELAPSDWRELCGRRVDWVEVVAG